MNYDDYDSEDSDEWQIQHKPNGEQGCRSYLGCQNNQSYYSEKNNSQLGYLSYSQSSESYYSERNNSQDGYKLACSDNQDITSYSPEKNKSPQGCKKQPPCIQDTYSSSGGSQGYDYNINNVEYNQHGGYEYGFNHYDYLPNYGDENYDDQTYFNGYKEPFCGSSSQQKPICRSTSSHVSKKLHKNSGIIHVKPNFGSNMYNVDAIHEERAKTQRRTEKLEVMIKFHGALTQLTEQWKIRQEELKELHKGFKKFRKEEDKARQKRHQKRKENKIMTNSLSIGGESQIFPILEEKMEKTLMFQEQKSDEVSLSSESPIPPIVEKQIVECLVIQKGKYDEKPRGEDPQITFYEDQNMVEIENSKIDMIMGDKANLSKPPMAMLENTSNSGQNTTILGGQENSSYSEPNEQENSTTFLAESLHGLQKHEIHVENARKSRLGVKHGWPPPMVQGLSALF